VLGGGRVLSLQGFPPWRKTRSHGRA
jgi:hypothetical protein